MQCTIKMPDGTRKRIQSSRRYAVVVNHNGMWHIVKRSDNEQTVLAEWRGRMRSYPERPAHIIDTAEKAVIK